MEQSTHDVRWVRWFGIITECQQRPVGVSAKNGLPITESRKKLIAAVRANGVTLEVTGDISELLLREI